MKKTKQLAFRGGSYSIVITAIVLAILIVVNLCVSSLPQSLTKYDISASKLYSVTSNTKVVVNNLQDDITIYWIVQADKEDSILENLLSKYESLSDHITVVKKNPDVFPTFAEQYTNQTVFNNSLVVECGERYRYIAYSDIYLSESGTGSVSSFDGEGAITSAIDYVISDELPVLYLLEGHGESELPTNFSNQITKENYELKSLSLLKVDSVPDDATCLIIYGPQSDISANEKTMLSKYVSNGGKLLVMAGPVEDESLTNLYSILSGYGVSLTEGIVIESDRNHYAFQYPYILLPDMSESDVTEPLVEEKYTPIIPIASGLNTDNASGSVSTILTTSSSSFSKLSGFSLDTYEKEEGDVDGPFAVAVSIETAGEGKIIWFSSSVFMDDTYNSYSSGANVNLAMNSLSSLVGEREAIAIRSKSLSYNYLTINDSQGAVLKACMIVILPMVYLGTGIGVVMSTRRKQNEAA